MRKVTVADVQQEAVSIALCDITRCGLYAGGRYGQQVLLPLLCARVLSIWVRAEPASLRGPTVLDCANDRHECNFLHRLPLPNSQSHLIAPFRA